MANVRFVYLWPMYGLFIYGQCTVCLLMVNVQFVYLWPVYGLFINGQCTVCLFMASVRFGTLAINEQTVHWP
jgi:hypothetical protein